MILLEMCIYLFFYLQITDVHYIYIPLIDWY